MTLRRSAAVVALLCATLGVLAASAPASPMGKQTRANRPSLAQIGATKTSVSVAWPGVVSRPGTVLFALYNNGLFAGWTWNLKFTIFGLACGSHYHVTVRAAVSPGTYAAGSVSTAGCAHRVTAPRVPHRLAPTHATPLRAPGGMRVVRRGVSSITLAWATGATANAAYGVYRNGVRVGASRKGLFTFSQLACGRSYTLGVDAVRGGTRSTRATVIAATTECARKGVAGHETPAPAPSAPAAPTAPPPSVSGGTSTTPSTGGAAPVAGQSAGGTPATGTSSGAGGTSGSNGGSTTGSSGGSGTGSSAGSGTGSSGGSGTGSPGGSGTGSTGGASGSSTVTLWVSPSGSDVTCARGNAALPCATYQRAYSLAQSGDLVQVAPGVYPATNPAGGAIEINTTNPSLSSYVTFVCQSGAAADSVDQASNAFNLAIKANWVSFRGSCFHFRILHVNYPGDSGLGADHVLIDGVHMDSFQLSGAHDTTIENSEIGPILSCYGNGQGSQAASCSNYANFPATWQAVARWWSQTPSGGSTGQQTEPYVHDRGNGSDTNQCSHNVTFVHDRFHDVQATDSAVNHTGGLLIDGGACQSWDHNLVIAGSVFEHNMSYGIEMDGPMSGSIIQNNWIGQGYGSLGAGGSMNFQQDVGRGDSIEAGCRGGQHKVADMLIRYNSADGYIAVNGNGDAPGSGCWTNVRLIGNIYANSVFGGVGCGGINSSYSEVTMEYNVVKGAACGVRAKVIGSWPYVSTGPTSIDFDLQNRHYSFGSWVPNPSTDYRVLTDFHQKSRAFPTSAGAVAPLRPAASTHQKAKRRTRSDASR